MNKISTFLPSVDFFFPQHSVWYCSFSENTTKFFPAIYPLSGVSLKYCIWYNNPLQLFAVEERKTLNESACARIIKVTCPLSPALTFLPEVKVELWVCSDHAWPPWVSRHFSPDNISHGKLHMRLLFCY